MAPNRIRFGASGFWRTGAPGASTRVHDIQNWLLDAGPSPQWA